MCLKLTDQIYQKLFNMQARTPVYCVQRTCHVFTHCTLGGRYVALSVTQKGYAGILKECFVAY